MTEALAFWGVAIVIGALALPLAFRLFARFPDAGAGLAFSLGLTLVASGYFLLRVVGVLPAGHGGFLLAIALFGVITCVFAARDRRFLATFWRSLPGLALVATLFSVLFFGYAFFRAYVPDIAHTEQPMDLLYLNAMLVSPDYPPHDPWFAGENASYHYGGYLQAAILTGASDVWPASAYNLSLGAVFASAGAAAFSLAAALARWLFGRRGRRWVAIAAATAVLLLLFAGPLASVFEFASAHGADHEEVYQTFGAEGLVRCGPDAGETCTGLPLGPTNAWYPDDHWVWWRMSRMSYWGPQPSYPFTVTEVPAFSFLLGDLHPHVMAIPGVLLALALCAAFWRGRGRLSWREHIRRPWLLVVVALIFGSLAFVNVWDVVVFSPLLALAVLARNTRVNSFGESLAHTVSWLLPPALLSVIVFLPWWIDFTPENGGVYGYSGQGTRIRHVLLMWGVPIVFALPVLWWALRWWRSDFPLLAAFAPRAIWRVLGRWRSALPFLLALTPRALWWTFRQGRSLLVALAPQSLWRVFRRGRSILVALAPRALWRVFRRGLSVVVASAPQALWRTLRRGCAALRARPSMLAAPLLAMARALGRWWAAFFARPLLVALLPVALPLLIWLPLAAFERTAAPFDVGDGLPSAFAARTARGWFTLGFYGVTLWLLSAATLLLNYRRHPAAPVACLGTLGVLLLYGTELFLLRDILFFIPRLNTVFKLSYQAWIVLSIAGAVGAVAAIRAVAPPIRPLVAVPVVVLLGSALVFAVTNTPNRAGGFEVRVGLDGLAYVERLNPAEYELVRWLNENVGRDEIVVESSGRLWRRGEDGEAVLAEGGSSYGASGRVGYRTGLQTLIGWPGHERTWRGASPELNEEIARRQDLVDLVYTAGTEAQALDALREIGATYVVVGAIERAHYRDDLIPPFETFLDTVFSEGDVTVFRIPTLEVVATR